MEIPTKERIEKAQALADKIKIKVDGLENELSGAITDIQDLISEVDAINSNPSSIIESKTSLKQNASEQLVLDVNGSGELHLYHLTTGGYQTRTTRATAKIVIDDTFTMYIPMGNTEKDYATTSGWKGDALFLTFDYMVMCNSYSSGTSNRYYYLTYKIKGNEQIRAYFPYYRYNANGLDVVMGSSGSSSAGVLGCLCDIPSDNQMLSDTLYCFLASPKPFAFEKSLKIFVTNNVGTLTSRAYYKLT